MGDAWWVAVESTRPRHATEATRTMKRRIEPELLDELAPEDLEAVGSRKDLQRLNAWMGNDVIMARALRSVFPEQGPRRVTELGAGDGEFMLRVSRRLCRDWQGTSVALLDRQNIVRPATRNRFAALGWPLETVTADVFDWVHWPAERAGEAMVANLFLHHFSEAQLAELLREAAKRAEVFAAVEPRRWLLGLTFSRWLWLIGCNRVTRHDAVISVRAGFADRELSQLWPADGSWRLKERPAGLFSHLFVAQRKGSRQHNHGRTEPQTSEEQGKLSG